MDPSYVEKTARMLRHSTIVPGVNNEDQGGPSRTKVVLVVLVVVTPVRGAQPLHTRGK